MNMTTWWLALALMLLCEGALIGIAPAVWRRTMRQLGELPDNALRRIGLGMAATAILIVARALETPHNHPSLPHLCNGLQTRNTRQPIKTHPY